MHINILPLLCFLSGLLSLILLIYALSKKRTSLNLLFAFFALCASIYAFGYGFELLNKALSGILFWSRIQYLGIAFTPGIVILIAVYYTGKESSLNKVLYCLIFTIPAITLLSRFSNTYHNLFYQHVSIVLSPYGHLLEIDPGPFYYLHIGYSNLAWIFAAYLLVRYHKQTLFFYKRQSFVILAALIVQWSGLFLYLLGVGPDNVDLNPFLVSTSSILFMIGIFRYSLFDIAPLARDRVFEDINEAIMVVDSKLRLADYNRVCEHIFPEVRQKTGYNISEVLIKHPQIFNVFLNESVENLEVQILVNYTKKHYSLSLFPLFNEKKQLIGKILSFTDISRLKKLMQNLHDLASTDELTGILNRRELYKRIDIEIKRSSRTHRPLSLLILDLDHFKKINDSIGHLGGDVVLAHFVETVKKEIREIDLFGRYGGEEFIVLLPDTNLDSAMLVAHRLVNAVAKSSAVYNGKSIFFTVSIGVTGTEGIDDPDIDILLHLADQGLYDAKDQGRNCVVKRTGEDKN